MPILNQNNFPYLFSWDDVNRTHDVKLHHKQSTVINFFNESITGWLVGLFHSDGFYHFPINTVVHHDILLSIRKKEIKLIIWNCHEPYHNIVEGIYKFVVMGGDIPADSIILYSNSADIDKEIDVVSKKYNLGKIKAVYSREFECYAKSYILNNLNTDWPVTLVQKQYNKKFLSFNGLWRHHRAAFVSFLSIFDLLDKGHLSYCALKTDTDRTPNDTFVSMMYLYNENPKLNQLLTNNKDKLMNLNPIHLDTNYNNHFNKAHYNDFKKYLYEDTYFSVITETICLDVDGEPGLSGVGRLLSEKTWKPIIFKHPFIILGVLGVLKLLKELGYKTFSPYIDERYDDETDGPTRVYKVAKEVERLCNLTESELKEFLDFSKDIVEFNYNHLLEQQIFYKELN